MENKTDYLQLDLNEIVNQTISKKIQNLEKSLNELENENDNLKHTLYLTSKSLEKSQKELIVFEDIKKSFNNITNSPKENGWSGNTKAFNQCLCIESFLETYYGIKKEYSFHRDGYLEYNLAVNYYSNKESVIKVVESLFPINDFDLNNKIEIIKNFKMPFDFSKNLILDFVKNPHSNTNGEYLGLNGFYIPSLFSSSDKNFSKNIPYDLLFKNPHILEEDVFEIIIKNLSNSNCNSNYYYFYALPKYNQNISKEQIVLLGQTLKYRSEHTFKSYEIVRTFVKTYINSIDEDILNFFWEKMNTKGDYVFLDWNNFPIKYQKEFLKTKNLEEILNIFSKSCKWSLSEKEEFLKDFLTK